MIRTEGLTKRYGQLTAVAGVDLEVREGDRFGLLGPNGSGKTTLLRLILGLVFATSGRIEVLGSAMPKHTRKVLRSVGALVEGPAGYPHLSGRTNLALMDAAGPGGSRRTRRRRVDEVLERVGLGGIDARPIRAYSLGMRQRLGLAGALLCRPTLLILDEPTNGLDPRGIRDIRDLLAEVNGEGVTVFLSSHLLAEVEQVCTRVGVMDAGRLVLQEEIEGLRAPTGRVMVQTPDAGRAAGLLDGAVAERDGDRLFVRGFDPAQLNAWLVEAGIRVSAIAAERRTLEQVVLEVTGSGSDRVDAAPRPEPGGPPRAAPPSPVPPSTGPPVGRAATGPAGEPDDTLDFAERSQTVDFGPSTRWEPR